MMEKLTNKLTEEELTGVVGGKTDVFGEYIVDGGPAHRKDATRQPAEYFEDGDWMCYKIKQGDTLKKISEHFGVSVERLQYLNRNTILQTSQIYEGDIIRIRLARG